MEVKRHVVVSWHTGTFHQCFSLGTNMGFIDYHGYSRMYYSFKASYGSIFECSSSGVTKHRAVSQVSKRETTSFLYHAYPMRRLCFESRGSAVDTREHTSLSSCLNFSILSHPHASLYTGDATSNISSSKLSKSKCIHQHSHPQLYLFLGPPPPNIPTPLVASNTTPTSNPPSKSNKQPNQN